MRIVKVNSTNLPSFKKKKDLTKWVISIFEQQRNAHIESTGLEVYFGNMAAKRDTIKQDYKDVNTIAVYSQIQELVSEANFVTFIPADEEHKTSVKGQNIYNAKIDIDNIEYLVRIKVDVPLWIIGSYNYAGHKIIKM